MGKRRPRRRWLRRAREPMRWLLCFGVAGLIHGYAYLDHMGRMLFLGAGPRPDAVRVSLVPQDRVPAALRHPAEEPGQIADATSRRPEPSRREPAGPLDAEEARKLLEEARLADDPLAMTPDAILESIEEAVRRKEAEGVKDPEAAMARADALSRGISSDSANEIANYLGYQAAEYVPKDPPPPGDFDFDDSTLYDLKKAAWEDGTPTYQVTMVDRAGRTHVFLVPPDEDPGAYDHFYNLLQAAKENPALGVILRRMVLPMASKLARSAERKRRPAPPDGPQRPGPPPPAPTPQPSTSVPVPRTPPATQLPPAPPRRPSRPDDDGEW